MTTRTRTLGKVAAVASALSMLAITLTACGGGGGESTVAQDCTPAHTFTTVTEGSLTVATYDYPPFTKINGDKLEDLEGVLLNEVAKRECLTLVVESSGGAGAVIPSVQTGRADLGAGAWYRTKERAKIVHLSSPLVLDPTGIISTTGIKSDDLKGHKVGSVAGNLYNSSLQKWLGNDFKVYQDDESIYGDLAAGRLDAIVASESSEITRMKDNPIEGNQIIEATPNDNVPEFASPGQVMWPSSKDNADLGKAIDEDIEAMHKDGFIEKALKDAGLNPKSADVGTPSAL